MTGRYLQFYGIFTPYRTKGCLHDLPAYTIRLEKKYRSAFWPRLAKYHIVCIIKGFRPVIRQLLPGAAADELGGPIPEPPQDLLAAAAAADEPPAQGIGAAQHSSGSEEFETDSDGSSSSEYETDSEDENQASAAGSQASSKSALAIAVYD